MPSGDKTGPRGLGSMTGRGLGYCASYSAPGYTKGSGMGFGRGRRVGFGRGMAWHMGWMKGPGGYWGYRNPMSRPAFVQAPIYTQVSAPEQLEMLNQEKQYLESEMEGFKKAIEDISKRIEELEIEKKTI